MADETEPAPASGRGENGTGGARPGARGDRDVVAILAKALRKLGQAGEVDAAMRLGGQAWWALNADDPDAAEHINGVMHYLARLPQDGEAGTA